MRDALVFARLTGGYWPPRSCRITSARSAGVRPPKCRCWPPWMAWPCCAPAPWRAAAVAAIRQRSPRSFPPLTVTSVPEHAAVYAPIRAQHNLMRGRCLSCVEHSQAWSWQVPWQWPPQRRQAQVARPVQVVPRPVQVATACQPSASRCLALTRRLRPEGHSTGSSSARLGRITRASPARGQVPEIPGGACSASPGCRSVWYRPRCQKRLSTAY